MAGVWTEHSALQELAARAQALETSNKEIVAENTALRDRCARLTEEANMDKFKCQLLVEMVRSFIRSFVFMCAVLYIPTWRLIA